MKRRSLFFKNAAILTATSLILRTAGIVFRLYLSSVIGAEGMGLYQLIVSLYVLGSTFAASGISTAVTRLVADELACGTAQTVRRIVRRAVLLSVAVGLATAVLIHAGAPFISRCWIHDERAIPALRILSFGFPFMGISSCLRGYFIARRRAAENARAQLLEQAVRLGLVFALVGRFARQGLATACFAVMLADTAAEAIACAAVAVGYARDRRRLSREPAAVPPSPSASVVRRLLAIAAPITAGRYLNSLLRTAENLLVPQNIAAYCHSREQGLQQFGALKGMALPLIFFPASFLSALTTLLLPELSAANALHQQARIRTAVETSLRITLLSSLPIGAAFLLFSREWGLLFYHSTEVGVYLRVLAPLTPVMYLESIADGLLKGLNQQTSSLKYSVADSALRLVLIVLWVPRRGMGGFLAIMVVSNLLTSFLNLHRLLTVAGVRVQWERWVLRPLACLLVASAAALALVQLPSLRTLAGPVRLAGGLLCLCGLYAALLFRLHGARLRALRRGNT